MLFLYLGFLSHDIQHSQGSMGREMPILIPLIYQPGNQGDANFNSFLPYLMPILIPLTYQPGISAELTSAHGQRPVSNRKPLVSEPKSLTAKPRSLEFTVCLEEKQRSVFRTVEHLQWCSFGKIVSNFPPLYRFYTLFSQKAPSQMCDWLPNANLKQILKRACVEVLLIIFCETCSTKTV